MDKAIIYGVYHFLGFSLCKQLLEQGIQVDGYPIGNLEEHEFLDEKKFLIGRNANFYECHLNDDPLISDESTQKNVAVISFYDLYFFSNKVDLFFQQILTCILKLTKIERIICLCPDNIQTTHQEMIKTQFNSSNLSNIPLLFIYLPTIFGPWQSSSFYFQQHLLKEYTDIEPKLDQRENTMDAIYIDDVINDIIKIIQSEEKTDVHLKSNESDKWLKCASYLNIEEVEKVIKEKNQFKTGNLRKREIMEETSIEKGFHIQKNHLKNLIDSTL